MFGTLPLALVFATNLHLAVMGTPLSLLWSAVLVMTWQRV